MIKEYSCAVDPNLLLYKYRTYARERFNLTPFEIKPDDIIQTNVGCLLMLDYGGQRLAAAFLPANVQLNPVLDLKLHRDAASHAEG